MHTDKKIKHLPQKQIDKLIKEEPDITIKEYLALLDELSTIKKTTIKNDKNTGRSYNKS
jgi:hypothetical protein